MVMKIDFKDRKGNNYEIGGSVGEGGACHVKLAVRDDGEEFAIKYLKNKNLKNKIWEKGLKEEYNISQIFSKVGKFPSHIIHIYDFLNLGDRNGLLMPYMRRGNLNEKMKESEEYRLSDKKKIAKQITLGIMPLHNNSIVHRDIKPANILFDEKDDIKITDFGLAHNPSFFEWVFKLPAKELFKKIVSKKPKKTLGGTITYMSPQALSGRQPDKKDDVYSTSVLFYELFTGKKLFNIYYNRNSPASEQKSYRRELEKRIENEGINNEEKNNLKKAGLESNTFNCLIAGMRYRKKDRPDMRDLCRVL